jgi:hypothetical protein
MDSSFSIADAEEGYLQITASAKDIVEVTFEQWNSIFGEIFFIDDGANVTVGKSSQRKLPGYISASFKGGEFTANKERKVIEFSSDIDFRFYFPNSYMFCLSIENDKSTIDPQKVSKNYNSFYHIPNDSIEQFSQYLCILLSETIKLGNINNIEHYQEVMLPKFMAGFECYYILRPVIYVADKKICIRRAEDFDKDTLFNLYFNSLFQKNTDYEEDKELRILFILRHKTLGYLPVRKDPILLDLKPILHILGV